MSLHYDQIGENYAQKRKPDPRIAAAIDAALGDSRSVLNVGAGAGSYEPASRDVRAVEPSVLMISQRPSHAAPCVQASAEALPFADRSFDAAMAVLTIHHWTDWPQGLREMRRVARGRIVLLTWDPDHDTFWLTRDYWPEFLAIDREIMPSLDALQSVLGPATIDPLPIPHDCSDGFFGAYWRRPEAYLDPTIRAAISTFARFDSLEPGLSHLAADLETGAWARRNAKLLHADSADIGYRLVCWS